MEDIKIMTVIGLIRHGSTSWNKEGRAQGSSNIALDEDGVAQAKLLAERLKLENWSVIYSSKQFRARQTAEIIAEGLGLPVLSDDRLKERAGGQIEGTTEQERIRKWGDNWRELELGIETVGEVAHRGIEVINELALKHYGQNVLVVSHGALIQHTFAGLIPDHPSDHVNNASITTIHKTDDNWVCKLYNCTRHVEHG
jgi:2,3-bisphosphoglycerate-dependent phosphoglycerate mutase